MTRMQSMIFLAILAAAGTVFADEVLMKINPDRAQFQATRARLIEQLGTDQYSEITPANKSAAIAALDRIDARLAKQGPLSDQDRVDIYNDQELVNTITSHAAIESRMYCEREMPTGSHRIRVICLTIAKWMERERTGQTAMHAVQDNRNAKCPACN